MPKFEFAAIEHAAQTDVGVRRSHNQDTFASLVAGDLRAWQEQGNLYLVADGMGGHAVGELASKLASELIPHTFQKHTGQGPSPAIRKAFAEANARIHERGQQNPEFEGMGTTCTALLLRPDGAWVGHVGDSRCYRIRVGVIEQLSYDHSFQWELARRQRVHPDQINVPSNVIIRSLGPEAEVQVDIEGPHPILPGDQYLLCSDGLSNQVTDPEMGAVVSALPPEEAARFLIELANLRGGPDNITVVLVKIPGDPPQKPAHTVSSSMLPPVRWYHRLPWSGIALGAGVTLAFLALVAIFFDRTIALLIFLAAGATLTAGIIGLLKAYQHERNREPQEEGTLRVYRQNPCFIDRTLLQKLSDARASLEAKIREREWKLDWDKLLEHVDSAENLATDGKFTEAFGEQCRAMTILASVVREHRQKEEVFQPHW